MALLGASMTKTVKIDTLGTHIMFKNMNRRIVDIYRRKGIIPTMEEHRKTFQETYGVKISGLNGIWSHLEFPDEQAYMMAALKWAG